MTNDETPNILTPSSAASALALKTHLHTLHQDLAQAGGDVDDETQDLLRQLDTDIKQVLERRDQNEEMFNRLFADKDFGGMVQEWSGCSSACMRRCGVAEKLHKWHAATTAVSDKGGVYSDE